MKRERFLADLRKWCRKNGLDLRVDTIGGKGSHVKVYVGDAGTIVKDGELSPIYVQLLLKQLGLPKDTI